ncbi:MAG: hypothetical protein HYU67_13725 [Flavobacteriia bacterium]|nr:hypothetical protein [Flavobacteriia bacterium]
MEKTCDIKFFAGLADKIGKASDIIQIDWSIGEDVKNYFKKKYPQLNALPFCVAVDLEIVEVFPDKEIKELVLMPPFAGG